MTPELEGPKGQLPPLGVLFVLIVMTVLFVFNVIADVVYQGYSGLPTTSLIGAIISSILGIDRYLRGGVRR